MIPGDLLAQVEALSTALSALQRAVVPDQVWHATDDQVLSACRDLSALRARTEAVHLAVVAEVDRRRAASGTVTGTGGGTSLGSTTEGLLRTAALVSAAQARRDVAAAHALHGRTTDRGTTVPAVLPVLAEQLARGTLTREHVDVAVRCLDRVPRHLTGVASEGEGSPVAAEQLAASMTDVVVTFVSEVAGTGTAKDLDRACQVLLQGLDPDGSSRFYPAAFERRHLDMSTDSTGMLLGRFQLDAAAGLALRAAIDAHSAPTPTEDGLRDPRSACQRRADALVTVAETARAAAAPVRGEPARVVVHVTPEQLAATARPDTTRTSGSWSRGAGDGGASGPAGASWSGGAAWAETGEPLRRPTVRRVACDAVLHRVLVGPSAGPLELGREVRLASRTQRRALASRDRGCVVPGCGSPPDACDAHHVRHWADGGPTDLGNLVLLCGSHHTAVHAGTWSVVVCEDGVPEVLPPRWVDPDRRPRRLWHHLAAGAAQAAHDRVATGAAQAAHDRRATGAAQATHDRSPTDESCPTRQPATADGHVTSDAGCFRDAHGSPGDHRTVDARITDAHRTAPTQRHSADGRPTPEENTTANERGVTQRLGASGAADPPARAASGQPAPPRRCTGRDAPAPAWRHGRTPVHDGSGGLAAPVVLPWRSTTVPADAAPSLAAATARGAYEEHLVALLDTG